MMYNPKEQMLPCQCIKIGTYEIPVKRNSSLGVKVDSKGFLFHAKSLNSSKLNNINIRPVDIKNILYYRNISKSKELIIFIEPSDKSAKRINNQLELDKNGFYLNPNSETETHKRFIFFTSAKKDEDVEVVLNIFHNIFSKKAEELNYDEFNYYIANSLLKNNEEIFERSKTPSLSMEEIQKRSDLRYKEVISEIEYGGNRVAAQMEGMESIVQDSSVSNFITPPFEEDEIQPNLTISDADSSTIVEKNTDNIAEKDNELPSSASTYHIKRKLMCVSIRVGSYLCPGTCPVFLGQNELQFCVFKQSTEHENDYIVLKASDIIKVVTSCEELPFMSILVTNACAEVIRNKFSLKQIKVDFNPNSKDDNVKWIFFLFSTDEVNRETIFNYLAYNLPEEAEHIEIKDKNKALSFICSRIPEVKETEAFKKCLETCSISEPNNQLASDFNSSLSCGEDVLTQTVKYIKPGNELTTQTVFVMQQSNSSSHELQSPVLKHALLTSVPSATNTNPTSAMNEKDTYFPRGHNLPQLPPSMNSNKYSVTRKPEANSVPNKGKLVPVKPVFSQSSSIITSLQQYVTNIPSSVNTSKSSTVQIHQTSDCAVPLINSNVINVGNQANSAVLQSQINSRPTLSLNSFHKSAVTSSDNLPIVTVSNPRNSTSHCPQANPALHQSQASSTSAVITNVHTRPLLPKSSAILSMPNLRQQNQPDKVSTLKNSSSIPKSFDNPSPHSGIKNIAVASSLPNNQNNILLTEENESSICEKYPKSDIMIISCLSIRINSTIILPFDEENPLKVTITPECFCFQIVKETKDSKSITIILKKDDLCCVRGFVQDPAFIMILVSESCANRIEKQLASANAVHIKHKPQEFDEQQTIKFSIRTSSIAKKNIGKFFVRLNNHLKQKFPGSEGDLYDTLDKAKSKDIQAQFFSEYVKNEKSCTKITPAKGNQLKGTAKPRLLIEPPKSFERRQNANKQIFKPLTAKKCSTSSQKNKKDNVHGKARNENTKQMTEAAKSNARSSICESSEIRSPESKSFEISRLSDSEPDEAVESFNPLCESVPPPERIEIETRKSIDLKILSDKETFNQKSNEIKGSSNQKEIEMIDLSDLNPTETIKSSDPEANKQNNEKNENIHSNDTSGSETSLADNTTSKEDSVPYDASKKPKNHAVKSFPKSTVTSLPNEHSKLSYFAKKSNEDNCSLSIKTEQTFNSSAFSVKTEEDSIENKPVQSSNDPIVIDLISDDDDDDKSSIDDDGSLTEDETLKYKSKKHPDSSEKKAVKIHASQDENSNDKNLLKDAVKKRPLIGPKFFKESLKESSKKIFSSAVVNKLNETKFSTHENKLNPTKRTQQESPKKDYIQMLYDCGTEKSPKSKENINTDKDNMHFTSKENIKSENECIEKNNDDNMDFVDVNTDLIDNLNLENSTTIGPVRDISSKIIKKKVIDKKKKKYTVKDDLLSDLPFPVRHDDLGIAEFVKTRKRNGKNSQTKESTGPQSSLLPSLKRKCSDENIPLATIDSSENDSVKSSGPIKLRISNNGLNMQSNLVISNDKNDHKVKSKKKSSSKKSSNSNLAPLEYKCQVPENCSDDDSDATVKNFPKPKITSEDYNKDLKKGNMLSKQPKVTSLITAENQVRLNDPPFFGNENVSTEYVENLTSQHINKMRSDNQLNKKTSNSIDNTNVSSPLKIKLCPEKISFAKKKSKINKKFSKEYFILNKDKKSSENSLKSNTKSSSKKSLKKKIKDKNISKSEEKKLSKKLSKNKKKCTKIKGIEKTAFVPVSLNSEKALIDSPDNSMNINNCQNISESTQVASELINDNKKVNDKIDGNDKIDFNDKIDDNDEINDDDNKSFNATASNTNCHEIKSEIDFKDVPNSDKMINASERFENHVKTESMNSNENSFNTKKRMAMLLEEMQKFVDNRPGSTETEWIEHFQFLVKDKQLNNNLDNSNIKSDMCENISIENRTENSSASDDSEIFITFESLNNSNSKRTTLKNGLENIKKESSKEDSEKTITVSVKEEILVTESKCEINQQIVTSNDNSNDKSVNKVDSEKTLSLEQLSSVAEPNITQLTGNHVDSDSSNDIDITNLLKRILPSQPILNEPESKKNVPENKVPENCLKENSVKAYESIGIIQLTCKYQGKLSDNLGTETSKSPEENTLNSEPSQTNEPNTSSELNQSFTSTKKDFLADEEEDDDYFIPLNIKKHKLELQRSAEESTTKKASVTEESTTKKASVTEESTTKKASVTEKSTIKTASVKSTSLLHSMLNNKKLKVNNALKRKLSNTNIQSSSKGKTLSPYKNQFHGTRYEKLNEQSWNRYSSHKRLESNKNKLSNFSSKKRYSSENDKSFHSYKKNNVFKKSKLPKKISSIKKTNEDTFRSHVSEKTKHVNQKNNLLHAKSNLHKRISEDMDETSNHSHHSTSSKQSSKRHRKDSSSSLKKREHCDRLRRGDHQKKQKSQERCNRSSKLSNTKRSEKIHEQLCKSHSSKGRSRSPNSLDHDKLSIKNKVYHSRSTSREKVYSPSSPTLSVSPYASAKDSFVRKRLFQSRRSLSRSPKRSSSRSLERKSSLRFSRRRSPSRFMSRRSSSRSPVRRSSSRSPVRRSSSRSPVRRSSLHSPRRRSSSLSPRRNSSKKSSSRSPRRRNISPCLSPIRFISNTPARKQSSSGSNISIPSSLERSLSPPSKSPPHVHSPSRRSSSDSVFDR